MERYAGLSVSDMSEELYPIDWFVGKLERTFPRTKFNVLPGTKEGLSGAETRAELTNKVLLTQTGDGDLWLVGAELIDTTAYTAEKSWGLIEEGGDERALILLMSFLRPSGEEKTFDEVMSRKIMEIGDMESYVEREVKKIIRVIDEEMIKEFTVYAMYEEDDPESAITTEYELSGDEDIITVHSVIVFEE